MEPFKRIMACAREQLPEQLRLLERLVRAESPTSHPEAHDAVQSLLVDALKTAGYRVVEVRGVRSAGHLLGIPRHRERGRPAQLLLGHSDTVWPIGTLHEMPVARIGDRMRGPGVYDMKGGLAIGLVALRILKMLAIDPPVTPLFFINSDEETGSRESACYIRMLARRVRRVFVLEPALGGDGKLKTARKGGGRFVVEVAGRSAHAGLNPGDGASAILELSHVIQRLYALNDLDRGVSINVGQIEGGLTPNVVASQSRAVVDVRVLTREDGERVEAAIRAIEAQTPGTRVTITGAIGRQPMERTARNEALWHQARRVGEALGLALQAGTAGGVSDGNTTSAFTATLDGLGAVGDGAHAAHEFVYMDALAERTALLACLLCLPASFPEDGAGERVHPRHEPGIAA